MRKSSFERLNERRTTLIIKKLGGDITPNEAERLKRMQERVGRYVDTRHPLRLDHLERRFSPNKTLETDGARCTCQEEEYDPHPDYKGICVACGKPRCSA